MSIKRISYCIVFLIVIFNSKLSHSQSPFPLVINEVMVTPAGGVSTNSLYDNGALTGSGPTDDAEWIELYNPSSCDSADISCFVLASNMGDSTSANWGTFLFPGGTVIPPLGHLVVGGNSSAFKDFNLINSINTSFCLSPRWWLRDNAGWIGIYKQNAEPVCGVYWTLTGNATNLFTDSVFNQEVETNPIKCTCCSPGFFPRAKDIPNIEYAGNVISGSSLSLSRKTDGDPVWELSSPNGTPGTCNGGIDSCFQFESTLLSTKPSCPTAHDGILSVSIPNSCNSVSPFGYLWSNGNTNSSISNLSAANYSLTITDKYGCKHIKTINLQSYPAISLNLNSNSPVCEGDTLDLFSTISADQYAWTGPNGFVSNLQNPFIFNMSQINSGVYHLAITDTNGCFANKNITIEMIPNPSCELGDNREICNQQQIELGNLNQNSHYNYNWFPVVGSSSEIAFDASLYQPSAITVYAEVSVCGKTAIDSVLIEILPCDLIVPNVITPNNDAYNDNFVVKNLEFYPNSQLSIFNRWGKIIYETDNYQNNWNGDQLAEGVYFYILRVPVKNQKEKEYHGTITLIGRN
ncbi:MAG: gliding motility-associated C-terminal domain-containing protein [Bacteroidetes bacterium]|nr:gliding motility-associated C-terminal domain-containing protein [Bacteroidota bacterium]